MSARVASLCASIEIRSLEGALAARWFHSSVNFVRVKYISAWRFISTSGEALGSKASSRSEHRGSRRRSSKGKSNRVASIWLVSSMETLSTKSKVSPTGSSSRILPARSRISGSMAAMLAVVNIGETTLRWASCTGGSSEMKLARSRGSLPSKMVMPPISESDENTWWAPSTATMSSYLVTDQ